MWYKPQGPRKQKQMGHEDRAFLPQFTPRQLMLRAGGQLPKTVVLAGQAWLRCPVPQLLAMAASC